MRGAQASGPVVRSKSAAGLLLINSRCFYVRQKASVASFSVISAIDRVQTN